MTINSSTRIAGPYTGNGSTTAYPFSFKVFSTAEVTVVQTNLSLVETTLTLGTNYTVSLNANQNSNPGGTVNMVSAPATGYKITLTSSLTYTQTLDLTNQGGFYPSTINDALDRATIQIQQLNEQVGRAAKVNISSGTDSTALVNNINTVAANLSTIQAVNSNQSNINTVSSNSSNINTVSTNNSNISTVASNIAAVNTAATNITAIQNASTNASNAASSASAASTSASNASTSASNASTSATNASASASSASGSATTATTQASAASTSATNAASSASSAATSATAAAASAASGMYSAVQDKSASYTVVAGDAGDLIRVTTTSGAVTMTLPTISTVGDGFKIAIVKWTSDGNAVSVIRSGSDTINGGTSYSLGNQYSSATFVADLETAQWFAVASGIGVSNVNVDVFSGNNSTVAFTLSGDPGSKNNTLVEISGVYQQKSTYMVSGTTLTFSTAPPTGTSNIEVVWTAPLAIGTPSDGTVTPAKLSTGGMYWDASGNVGIGATSIVSPLQIGVPAGSSPVGLTGLTFRQASGSPTTGYGYSVRWDNAQNISNDLGSIGYAFGGASAAAAGYMTLTTANAERMRIDGNGKVLINRTSSDGGQLNVVGATSTTTRAYINATLRNARTSGTHYGVISWDGKYVADAWIGQVPGTDALCFGHDAGTTIAESMRIDTNGYVGIGTTSPSYKFHVVGADLQLTTPSGNTVFGTTTTGSSATVSGGFQALQAQSLRVGTFGGSGAYNVEFVSQNNVRVVMAASGNFYPATDNAYSCGISGGRWSAIWAANATIQTSDINAKTDVVDSPLGLNFIAALRPVAYKYKVGRNQVIDNPEDTDNPTIVPIAGKRQHFGLIAQEVKAALPDGVDFGGWALTDLEDQNSEQGLRYDQFIAPMIKAIQEQQALITAFTARLTALENK